MPSPKLLKFTPDNVVNLGRNVVKLSFYQFA